MKRHPSPYIRDLLIAAHREQDPDAIRQIIEEILSLDENCAEAYYLLAGLQENPRHKEDVYLQSMEAAQTTLGEEAFERIDGTFGKDLFGPEAVYLASLANIVFLMADRGAYAELIQHGLESLRLNPKDPMNVRDIILGPLIEYGHQEEARSILDDFPEDKNESATYALGLLYFAKSGDTEEARAHIARALATAPRSEVYLLGEEPMPEFTREYLLTDESDAAIIADRLRGAFSAVPGALDWLATCVQDFGHATLVWVTPQNDSPSVTIARKAVLDMIYDMASEAGIDTKNISVSHSPQEAGAAMITKIEGRLYKVTHFARVILAEGLSGFKFEVEREEMLELDKLHPRGMSAFVRSTNTIYPLY